MNHESFVNLPQVIVLVVVVKWRVDNLIVAGNLLASCLKWRHLDDRPTRCYWNFSDSPICVEGNFL